MYQPRTYREGLNRERFHFFSSVFLESDLLLGVSHGAYQPGMTALCREVQEHLHAMIMEHGRKHPGFLDALHPLEVPDENEPPPQILDLYRAGQAAGTGPMAAVAGLFAREVGQALEREFSPPEILVENGGDLWLQNKEPLLLSIHAGESPLSDRLGLLLPPGRRGACTSSGTLGHSFSRGRADALTVVGEDAPLADAWATSLANRIQVPSDVEKTVALSQESPGILACVAIMGEQLGVQGEFEIKPIS